MRRPNGELLKTAQEAFDQPSKLRLPKLNYLRNLMTVLDQDVLIATFNEMNYYQLKMCFAAGIPGHAHIKAQELAKLHKERIKAVIYQTGASFSVEVENPED